jgi:hypothetical protein
MKTDEPDVRPSGPRQGAAGSVPHEEFVVTLRALPAPIEGVVRVRRLLKIAFRSLGLRCVSIRRKEELS